MENIIEINDWDRTCGDGCCYDYGVDLLLNGERITPYFCNSNGGFAEALKILLNKLGVEAKVMNNDTEVKECDATKSN